MPTPPPRYKIAQASKKGGQAEVLFCKDLNLDRLVAIKYMTSRHADEIRAFQAIKSKHVVQIYDYLTDSGQVGIVLEYIDGTDLDKLVAKKIDDKEIVNLLYQLACGVCDIHDHGHIHRDLKPHNIRVDSEGILKIFDFGLSREVGKDDHTVGFRGTHGYAAPELYQAGKIQLSKEVDIYAFGAIAWQMCAKSLPTALLKLPPTAAKSLSTVSSLPPSICSLVDACLSVTPGSRPNMQTIKDVLAKYLVQNQHTATFVVNYNGFSSVTLSATKRSVSVGKTNLGSFEVHYDGMDFHIRNITGAVFLNNTAVTSDLILPKACVIALGADRSRAFVSYDISHPEVVL